MVGTTSDWEDELGRWLKPFLDCYRGTSRNILSRANRCFCYGFKQSDTEENSVVAEGEKLTNNLLPGAFPGALPRERSLLQDAARVHSL